MTHSSSPLSENAVLLAKRALQSGDRVLVTGASGWFGRTSTWLFKELAIPVFLTGSHSRTIHYLGKSFEINEWNISDVNRFEPTIVIDCAYLTREFTETTSLDNYVAVNRDLVDRFIAMSKWPSVRRMIGFSSGAAFRYASGEVEHDISRDPYGVLKYESELRLSNEIESAKSKVSIPRVWSVAGSLVTKPNGFAFSDLISQARSGTVTINSENKVLRRYCLIEEVIAIALQENLMQSCVFDTGGESIEIGELAKIICDQVNPDASIVRNGQLRGEANDYRSSNIDWIERCSQLAFKSKTIIDQISQVSRFM